MKELIFILLICMFFCVNVSGNDSEVLLPVRKNNKWGYIDGTGKVIIPFKFDRIPVMEIYNNRCLYLDAAGKEVISGFVMDKTTGMKWKLDAGGNFMDGLAWFSSGGLYGYINTNGHVVIPPRYKSIAHNFSQGRASIYIDGYAGVIDRTGRVIVRPKYERINEFMNGFARVYSSSPGTRDGGLIGYIDLEGRVIWQPQK